MSIIAHAYQACRISQLSSIRSWRRCDRRRTASLAPIFRRPSRDPAERSTGALQSFIPNWQAASQRRRACPRALHGPTAKTHRRPQRSPSMGRLRSANPLIQKGPNAPNATNAKMQGCSFCRKEERLCRLPRGFSQRQLAPRTGALRPSSAATVKDRAGVVHGFQAILSPRHLSGGERPLSSLTKALPWSP